MQYIFYRIELVLAIIISFQRRYIHTIKNYWYELKEAYSTSELLEQVLLITITLVIAVSTIIIAICGLLTY